MRISINQYKYKHYKKNISKSIFYCVWWNKIYFWNIWCNYINNIKKIKLIDEIMYKLSNNIINVCGIMNKIKGYENILDTSLTRAKELINNRGNNEIINEG